MAFIEVVSRVDSSEFEIGSTLIGKAKGEDIVWTLGKS